MNKQFIFRLSLFITTLIPLVASAQVQEIKLQDVIRSRKFFPKSVYGLQSLKNGEQYTVLENDSLNVYNYSDGKLARTILTRSELIPEGDTAAISLTSFTLSRDEKKVLIPTSTEHIYRYSSTSFYYLFDLDTRRLSPLSSREKQRLAEFSPDGMRAAFVHENNLVVSDLAIGKELQVTEDGEINRVINGTTDWVYEEEFAITKGFQWSPDSKKIAYYRFDESGVREFTMTEWGDLYPEEYRFKYPKAGEDNSLVDIYIYNVESGDKVRVDLGPETDQYIPRIYWTEDPDRLFIFRLNRLQNRLEILQADGATGMTTTVYTEENPYYIEESHYDNLVFIDDESFLLTSERSGWYHIWRFFVNGDPGVDLTPGEFDVTDLYGYDSENGIVYFQAAYSSPLNREVCSTDLRGKLKVISREEGTNSAAFSDNFSYYINTFSDANTPPVITVNKAGGKEIRTLEDNQALRETMQEYGFSEKEFFRFTTSEGVVLNGFRILPGNMEKGKKYPVLFDIYGGPGSQTVLNSWDYSMAWHQMLAQQGYIVVSVDNRGTGSRGQEFKKMTYLQLGKYETIDQVEAAKYIATLDYVDPARIGVWGWSYGGFMSTLCITKGAEQFSMAIAVAPVTNWRYYDNIYTERFMRKPQDNAAGYDDNSPINHVDELKGKYLVVHGTGDDNVHVQNTIDLIDALVKANKQFDMFLYPNRNHGIYGGNTRLHLYTLLTDYIYENL